MSLTDRTSAKDDEVEDEASLLFSTDDEGTLWATGCEVPTKSFQLNLHCYYIAHQCR